jgi:HEPN/RES N-terminal domain 1/RES domain
MGRMKELLELGWTPIGKSICPDCVTNPALKAIVEENLAWERCDYCGRQGETVAADTYALMEHITESIETEWAEPVEELPYETAEGGYQGDWCTFDELVHELGEDIGCDEFVDDVIAAYGGRGWCQRDYFQARLDEALGFSWERFAEIVKYRSRYVFMRLPDDDEYREYHEVEPAQMLSKIGELVVENGLVSEIPAGTGVYRARVHGRGDDAEGAAALGPPPRELSRSGRMSPAGIPLFYGAMDTETAVAEVWEGPEEGREAITVGRFTTTAPLSVIDLARVPEIPSIFDERGRELRGPLRFLHRFSRIVSEPVNRPPRSEQEAVEYVPTQVVTDYFRNMFELEHGRPIKGLVYRSARRDGGTCCALFIEREAFGDAGKGGASADAVIVPKRARHASCKNSLRIRTLTRMSGESERGNELVVVSWRRSRGSLRPRLTGLPVLKAPTS